MKRLWLRNGQRRYRVNLRLLRQITRYLIGAMNGGRDFELGLHLVAAPEMTQVNEKFLRHAGSTDVITFDYGEPGHPDPLTGELFICVDEASIQAKRFHSTWESEIIRYVIHGLLHLRGYDDKTAAQRRKMKCEEDQFLEQVSARFRLEDLRQSADSLVRLRSQHIPRIKPVHAPKPSARKRTAQ